MTPTTRGVMHSFKHWTVTRVSGGEVSTMTAYLTTAQMINAQFMSRRELFIPRKAK